MNQVPAHMASDPSDPMLNAPAVAMPRSMSAAADVEMQRAIAEVQASIILAKKFPRDVDACLIEINRECARVQLAEIACYEYAKGGTKIEGPSIRLAEALKGAWGNIHSGWRELGRSVINGVQYAEIEAWAWDMEKNNREPVLFKAKLMRDTRSGSYPLKDEREIYEHCANQAKRRERAAILSVIPGWVQDMAVDACKETLKKTVNTDTTKRMIAAFEEKFDVKKEQIEKFIQANIDAITPAQVVRLRNIFTSLKDGMSKADEWFDAIEQPEQKKPEGKGAAGLKAKLKGEEASPAVATATANSSPSLSQETQSGTAAAPASTANEQPKDGSTQTSSEPMCQHEWTTMHSPASGKEEDVCALCGELKDSKPAFLRNA